MWRFTALAPVILGMLLGERAISLNRVAAADVTGVLGQAIAREGRESVLPLLVSLFQEAVDENFLVPSTKGNLATLFINLLMGDQQIRRVIGTLPPPTSAQIEAQAEIAVAQFLALCGG